MQVIQNKKYHEIFLMVKIKKINESISNRWSWFYGKKEFKIS